MVDRCAYGLDALAFDENLAGLEHVAGIDLKQPRGVEDDGRGCRLLGGQEGSGHEQKRQSNRRAEGKRTKIARKIFA